MPRGRWGVVAQYIKKGMLLKRFRLVEKDKKLDLLDLQRPLRTFIPIPKQELKLKSSAKESYSQAFDDKYQPMVSSVLTHIQILSFKELLGALEICCENLMATIGKNPYRVAIVGGKSQEWIADIAYRFLPLEQLPQDVIEIGAVKKTAFEKLKLDFSKFLDINGKAVLFDDVAYTGTQLRDYIKIIDAKYKSKTDHQDTSELEVILVIPFMTKLAKENVLQAIKEVESGEENKLRFKLITHVELNNVKDVINSLNMTNLEEIYHLLEWPNVNPSIEAVDVEKDTYEIERINKKALIFTEWKTADGVSLPKLLSSKVDIHPDYLDKNHKELPTLLKEVACPYKM